jgi:predicted molibdopterin-dependent oxidoreductase YjgC
MMADVTLTIDGIEVSVPKGTFVIEAARKAGIYVSNMCTHPDMKPFGACRLCTIGMPSKWGFSYEIACATECKDGMAVFTENSNEDVRDIKKFITESLLIDHPLDCPICPASGACEMQNASWHYSMTENRMAREKLWHPQDYLSPAIIIKRDRCVLCGQCVRICEEVVGAKALAFVNRGIETFIDSAWGTDLTKSPCTSCGMCVEVCPVGCLMHAQFENTFLQWTLKRTDTTCNYCAVGCKMSLEAEVNTGLIQRVAFSKGVGTNDARSCVKGRYGHQYVNSAERLTVPLKRNGEKFEEITWQQAYDILHNNEAKYQGKAFGAIASGKLTNEDNYLFMKYVRGVMRSNNLDSPIRFTQMPSMVALQKQFGFAGMTNTIQDIKDFGECYLYAGLNVDASAPVLGMLLQESASRRGIPIIMVNPRKLTNMGKADVSLQIKPGTDAVLYNGMAHWIIKNGWLSTEYIVKQTEDFDNWRKTLDQYTPEYVAQVTGVDIEDLKFAAELYATGGHGKRNADTGLYPPSSIMFGTGVTQWSNGVENVHALANLALLTGNIGRQGAGLNPIQDQANDLGAADVGCLPDYLPSYVPVTNAEARAALETRWFGRTTGAIPAEPGLRYLEIFQAAEAGTIKAMYIAGENPILTAPDIAQIRRGIEKLEFLVVQDMFLTETARYADLILPAAAHAEKDGSYTNTERRINRVKKAVASPGIAKPDWRIFADLIDRPGLRANYRTAEEIFKELTEISPLYAGANYKKMERGRRVMTFKPGLAFVGAAYNQMWPFTISKYGVQYPVSAEGESEDGTPLLFEKNFATPSGKAKFVRVDAEAVSLNVNNEFPFLLTLGRNLAQDRDSNIDRRNYVLNALDLEPELELHPDDMDRLGLSNGDVVRVTSKQNALEVKVKANRSQLHGNAFMPWMFREAPAFLLVDQKVDERTGTPLLKNLGVRVEFVRKSQKGLLSTGANQEVVPV